MKDLRAELNALRAQTAQIRQQKDDLTERFDKLRETIRTQVTVILTLMNYCGLMREACLSGFKCSQDSERPEIQKRRGDRCSNQTAQSPPRDVES